MAAYQCLVDGTKEAKETTTAAASLLLDGVRDDRLHVLPHHLLLHRLLSVPAADVDAATVWNLRLLQALHQWKAASEGKDPTTSPLTAAPASRLFPPAALALIEERFRSVAVPASTASSVTAYPRPPLALSRAVEETAREAVDERRRIEARYQSWLDLPSEAETKTVLAVLSNQLKRRPGGRLQQGMERETEEEVEVDLQSLLPLASMYFPTLSVEALQQLLGELAFPQSEHNA